MLAATSKMISKVWTSLPTSAFGFEWRRRENEEEEGQPPPPLGK